MKSVVKSAASVRAKTSTPNPKKPAKLNMERPHSKAGGTRTGHEKDANNYKLNSFGTGMSTTSKSSKNSVKKRDPVKAMEKTKAMQTRVIGQMSNLTIPTASPDEKDYLDEYLHLFETLRTMIRISEDRYIEGNSTKEVYALMTMYSQLREVIADIRSISDMSNHAENIVTRVVQPSISNIAQSFVDMFYHIRLLIREIARDDQVQYGIRRVDEMMRDSGLLLQDQYVKMSDRITEVLVD